MGKPVRAARLAEDPDILREFADYFRRLKSLFERPDASTRLNFSEEAAENSAETQKFLEALSYFLRSFMLARAKEPVESSRYSAEKIVELIRECEEARQLIDRNVNPRLTLENLLLSI